LRRTPRDVKKSYRLRCGDLAGAQCGDWERRDQLHPGPSGYPHSRTALNLGLQAGAKRPSDCRRSTRGRADRGKCKQKAAVPGSGGLRRLRHQLEPVGHSAELGKRMGIHLPHGPAAVDLHGSFGDADIAGDLFAQATLRDMNYDFPLPGA
jgi:hypothetical protein